LEKSRKLIAAIFLGALLTTLAFPLATVSALTEEEQDQIQATWRTQGSWTYIQNDMITIVFPAGGKKPIFLWWYTKDPDNINVVKYEGLIEYVTFDKKYFI
jgi:hypothetical protein